MTADRDDSSTVSIDLDERGRVPFSLIAVLLLISSVMIVATLETRSEPVLERQTDRAMDRALAATQGELRTAVLEASYRAGTAPVISANESDVDAIADAPDQEARFRNYVKLLVYLETTETLSNAGSTVGSDTRTNVSISPVTASGSGASIDPDEAIDRVALDIGQFDDDLATGIVDATIDGVEFRVTRGETETLEQTRSITVSVGTPVFELHDRLTEYESQLNAGFFDEPLDSDVDGLGQHLGARLYPFAYFKAGWDRTQPTRTPDQHDFEEVIDVKHTEVLANHAIFDVQNDVFGTQDPYADRTMRPGFVCMATQMGNDIASGRRSNQDDGENSLVDPNTSGLDVDPDEIENETAVGDIETQLCDGGAVQEWIFGDNATGELPEMPPLSELIRGGLGELSVMDGSQEVPLDDVSRAAYLEYSTEEEMDMVEWMEEQTRAEMTAGNISPRTNGEAADLPAGSDEYDRSVRDIVEELYQVDLERETDAVDVSDSLPPSRSPDDRDNYTESSDSTVVDSVSDVRVDHETFENGTSSDRTLHDIGVTADLALERTQVWEADDPENTTPATRRFSTDRSVSLTAQIDIDGAYGFYRQGAYYDRDEFPVEDRPLDRDYESGSRNDSWRTNFENGFELAISELTTAESPARLSDDFAAEIESLEGDEISSTGALEDDIETDLTTDESTYTATLEDLKPNSATELLEELRTDLEDTHRDFLETLEAEPFEVERTELLDTPTPPARAIDHVRTEREADFVYDGFEGDTYENPAEVATAQVRKAYFDRIYYWLDLVATSYEEQVDETSDYVDDAGGSGTESLDDVLAFTQNAVNADVSYEPDEIDGSPVLEDVQFEVAGSPTYLTAENISQDRDPAIRPKNDTITDVDGETEHASLAIHTDNRIGWPGMPLIPTPPSFYLAQLNSWNVDVRGEYARFEASATVGDASSTGRLSVIREHRPIELTLEDGSTVAVGSNEPIDFDSSTEVIVMMPGGVMASGAVPSVADPGVTGTDGLDICSSTWDHVGPNFNEDELDNLACRDNN